MKVNLILSYAAFRSFFFLSNSCFSGVGWGGMGWDGMEGSFVFPARMGENCCDKVTNEARWDFLLSYGGLDYCLMTLPYTNTVYAPIPVAPPAYS